MAEITIENIPEVIEVLKRGSHCRKPKITSLEGEILGDNVNFEFDYKIEIKEEVRCNRSRW
ncbi:MAG: hypothetical protein ACLTZT_15745 [Butyricimonas faecalis]